jgi:hypothetical protein
MDIPNQPDASGKQIFKPFGLFWWAEQGSAKHLWDRVATSVGPVPAEPHATMVAGSCQ